MTSNLKEEFQWYLFLVVTMTSQQVFPIYLYSTSTWNFRAFLVISDSEVTLYWSCQCLWNLAIFQMGFYATVLLRASQFYSTATRILVWPVMAHSSYFYSVDVWTPLRPSHFIYGLIFWVLRELPQPSLFRVYHYCIPPFFNPLVLICSYVRFIDMWSYSNAIVVSKPYISCCFFIWFWEHSISSLHGAD